MKHLSQFDPALGIYGLPEPARSSALLVGGFYQDLGVLVITDWETCGPSARSAKAAEILDRAGWTLCGHYESANKPVAAICQGCGKVDGRRVGDIHAKLKEGTRLFGCMVCVRKKFPQPRTVPLEQAIEEFREAGIEYVGGWKSGQFPVDARCVECGHMFRPSLKHVRAGHGCPRCNLTGVWTIARVQRDPGLTARPSLLYLVEFTDWDPVAAVFHKVGIGTLDAISRPRGGGCDRLYRHYRDGARLVSSIEGDLLTCLTAERMILKHVASRRYTPTLNRIRAGNTGCFLPGEPIDQQTWVDQARESRAGRPAATAQAGL